MASIYVFPSTDLALLTGGKVSFTFMRQFLKTGQTVPIWTGLMSQGATVTPSFSASVATMSGSTLTAVGGEQIGTLTVRDGMDVFEVLVRVRVFDSITSLFCPHSSLALETDRTDRVLSIYATMKKGSKSVLCDITSHPPPQLSYHSSDKTIVDVDPLGRVKTFSKTGTATITVSTSAAEGGHRADLRESSWS